MLLRSINAVFDQLHSMKSADDAKRGMKENILQGYRAGGPAPYGYMLNRMHRGEDKHGQDITKSYLVPDPEIAPIVGEVFDRYASGESMASIAKELTRRGVPRARGGLYWDTNPVRQILDRADTYLGKLIWNRSGDRERRRHNPRAAKVRPEEVWVVKADAHEPLINEEIADKVKKMRSKQSKKSVYVDSSNLLGDLAWCEKCEQRLQGWGTNRLACSHAVRGNSDCNLTSVSQSAVIYAMLEMIFKHISTKKNTQLLTERIIKAYEHEEDDGSNEIKRRFKKVGKSIDKWNRVIDGIDSPEVASTIAQEKLSPLLNQKKEFVQELIEIATRKPPSITREDVQDALIILRDNLRDIDIKSSKEEVVSLLKLFVLRIYVDQKEKKGLKSSKLTIHWNPALISENTDKKSPQGDSTVGICGSGTGNRTPVTWLRTTRPNH